MERAVITGPRGSSWNVLVPTTRRERMMGLRAFPRADAMLFRRARSVHTFGMRRRLRVALLDDRFVVRNVIDVPPNRLVLPRRGGRHVLECGAEADVSPGDALVLS